ncbi:hypothetical protein D3C72_1532510 [compost metagenome]
MAQLLDPGFVRPGADAVLQGEFAPGEERTGILLALGGDIAVTQHLGLRYLVTADELLRQGADGGDLGLGIGLPVAQLDGEPFLPGLVAEVDDLDAERAGIEPGILMPAAAARMPGALAVGHQLVDGQRRLVCVAGDQVVGAHLVLRLGQQAQGVGVVFICVVQDQEGDALILVGAGIAGIEPIGGGLAGAQTKEQAA